MDAFADIEQLTYGESALREIVTFILTFSLEMVISVEGMDGDVITQIREDVHTFESVRSSVGLESFVTDPFSEGSTSSSAGRWN